MSHIITEYMTPRRSKMLEGITSPSRVFAGRNDNNFRFKLTGRDSFLEDLFEATGYDLRKRTDEEGAEYYPSHIIDGDVRLDVDWIADLMLTPPVFDRAGEIVVTPAVMGGPHLNLLLTAITFAGATACADCAAKLNKKFITDGTKSTRSVGK